MHKIKSGPELQTVTPEMLQGLENLAAMAKQAGDNNMYDFLTLCKTALSKYPVLSAHVKEMAILNRLAAKALTDAADFMEQLVPPPPVPHE